MEDKEKEVFIRALNKVVKMLLRVSALFYSWAGQLRYHIYMAKFGSRDDDIWIVTYPKSGTTVMQMILYQLTTDGNMDFRHINDICPWVRNAAIRGLHPPSLANPRVLKSHDKYNFFDKSTKGRFVYVIRNGMDVSVSHFHQLRNYNNPALQFDEVFAKSFSNVKGNSWYAFNRDWLLNRQGRRVLYIKYEDINEDKQNVIQRLADFLGLSINDEIMNRAIQRSHFEFMKQHEDKFGIEKMEDKRVYDQFIRKGVSGQGADYLSGEQKAIYNKMFDKSLKKLMKERFEN